MKLLTVVPLSLGAIAVLSACQTGAAPSGDAQSCATYSAKLCEAVGEGSEACATIKDAAAILPPAACAAAAGDVAFSVTKVKERRAPCEQLVQKLCADLGADTDACGLVKSKTPEFPVDRCEQMLQQYAQVLGGLQQMEAANKPLDTAKQAEIAAASAPSFGPAGAAVTLVEFSDFQCPYCSRAAVATKEIKKKYGERVRFVFRHFPLSFHENAHLAAQASMAAHAQGKFWDFHDTLFDNQQALDRASLETHGQKLGLDMAKFKKALDDGIYKGVVDADFKLGESVAVQGTPTLFLNGKRIQDPTSVEAISSAIDKALATN